MIALRVLVSLGAVLALLWWLQRRLSRGPRTARVNPVTVVTKQGIGSKASVVIVDIDGTRLVLGVTEQSVSVLQSADAPAPVVEPAAQFAKSMDAAVASPAAPLALVPTAPAQFSAAQFGGKRSFGSSMLSVDTWVQAATSLRRAR